MFFLYFLKQMNVLVGLIYVLSQGLVMESEITFLTES